MMVNSLVPSGMGYKLLFLCSYLPTGLVCAVLRLNIIMVSSISTFFIIASFTKI